MMVPRIRRTAQSRDNRGRSQTSLCSSPRKDRASFSTCTWSGAAHECVCACAVEIENKGKRGSPASTRALVHEVSHALSGTFGLPSGR